MRDTVGSQRPAERERESASARKVRARTCGD